MTVEERMKQSIEELVEKKTALEKRIFELEKENETLKMGLQYDSDNRDDILNENSDLQQKFLEENFEKSKLVKEKSKLEDINLKLCEQNNELVEENGTLKTQVSILQGKNKGLKELVKGYENTRDRMIAMGFPTFKSVKEYAAKLKELEKACDETQKLLDKQIEETYKLVEENTELKKKCYKKAVKDYCELEKENTELLEKLKNQKADYETYFKSCYNAQEKAEGQLTKAKELIEKLSKSLFLAKGIVRDLIDDTVDFKESKERAEYCYEQEKFDAYREAEQFLKEISE